jgi:hypothetical protein
MMVHDGAEAGAMRLPRRHGALFDPDRFRFLADDDAQVRHRGCETVRF